VSLLIFFPSFSLFFLLFSVGRVIMREIRPLTNFEGEDCGKGNTGTPGPPPFPPFFFSSLPPVNASTHAVSLVPMQVMQITYFFLILSFLLPRFTEGTDGDKPMRSHHSLFPLLFFFPCPASRGRRGSHSSGRNLCEWKRTTARLSPLSFLWSRRIWKIWFNFP